MSASGKLFYSVVGAAKLLDVSVRTLRRRLEERDMHPLPFQNRKGGGRSGYVHFLTAKQIKELKA